MGSDIRELSYALGIIVEKAGPAVVRVEARKRAPASGVIWDEGIVVTAEHAVETDDDARVALADGTVHRVDAVLRDEATDIAILKVSGLAPPSVSRSGDESLALGHLVLAISRPGRTARAMLGIVSVLGGAWRTAAGGRIERYIESDVDRPSGFSGSALVDSEGRIAGMNTSALVRGASLAIPSATVQRVVEALRDKGRVQRGYLGVSTYPVRMPAAVAAQARQEEALLVIGVQAGSPAERAGVLLGDAIVSLHGVPTRSLGELIEALGEEHIGQSTSLGLVRAGEVRELTIEIGTRGA